MEQQKQQQKPNETKFEKLAGALKQNLARRKNIEKICAENKDKNEIS